MMMTHGGDVTSDGEQEGEMESNIYVIQVT